MRKEGGGAGMNRILKVFLYCVCARKEEGKQDERGIWEVFLVVLCIFVIVCICFCICARKKEEQGERGFGKRGKKEGSLARLPPTLIANPKRITVAFLWIPKSPKNNKMRWFEYQLSLISKKKVPS